MPIDPCNAGARLGERGFTDAQLYERGRPDYPPDAIALFAERLELAPGRRVVDLGAGTGKLTRQLAGLGVELVAVEPSAAMRAAFARALPAVPVLDGRAESIPLADACADAVVVAQAFHWFDAPRALREIARVLRPGGGLGLVWNERDEREPWVRELSVAMRWHERQPYQVGLDFTPVLAAAGLYERIERTRFTHVQRLDQAGLLARVASTSYVVAMEAGERAAIMRDVERVLRRLPERLELPYVTDAYACRLRAR